VHECALLLHYLKIIVIISKQASQPASRSSRMEKVVFAQAFKYQFSLQMMTEQNDEFFIRKIDSQC